MKEFLGLILFVGITFVFLFLAQKCEDGKDPYEEGSHLDYSIECVNGYAYKIKKRAAMQVFNSDGTPHKCGTKIY